MPPRKDLMRIIRPDANFAATLGFGRAEIPPPNGTGPVQTTPTPDVDHVIPVPQPVEIPTLSEPVTEVPTARADPQSARRGIVIYVAVSLTAAQAIRAEHWAAVASCPVPLLMRRTAQAMRKDLFDLWALEGVDRVEEQRGARGHHPTSITLTLPPELAATFSAQLDPTGIIGLGRAIGPAFRMRFDAAFDAAATKAGFQ